MLCTDSVSIACSKNLPIKVNRKEKLVNSCVGQLALLFYPILSILSIFCLVEFVVFCFDFSFAQLLASHLHFDGVFSPNVSSFCSNPCEIFIHQYMQETNVDDEIIQSFVSPFYCPKNLINQNYDARQLVYIISIRNITF